MDSGQALSEHRGPHACVPTRAMRRVSIAAVLLGLGAAAGCGSSTPAVTHAEFVSQVNAVCRAAGNPYKGRRPTDPKAFLAFLQAQVPGQENGLRALKKLRPPQAERPTWSSEILSPEQQQLDDTQMAIARLQSFVSGQQSGQAAMVVRQTVDGLDGRGLGINRYWTTNGMTDCVDSSL